jgi:methyl-accepting chemotaxis protein
MATSGIPRFVLGTVISGMGTAAVLGALCLQDLQRGSVPQTVLLGAACLLTAAGLGANVAIGRRGLREMTELERRLQAITAGRPTAQASAPPLLLAGLAEQIRLADGHWAAANAQQKQLQGLTHEAADALTQSGQSIVDTAYQLAGSANQLANATQDLADGVSDSASRIATMDSSAAVAQSNVQQAATSSAVAAQLASQGQDTLLTAVEKLRTFQSVIAETADSTERLGSLSEQIGGIIGIIKRIADQTNLLALNAAIEAARAGEHGRGFAVVAEEVRHLSTETAASIKQIQGMIVEIQQETGKAVAATQHGTAEAANTATLIDDATNAMLMIAEAIADSDTRVGTIASAIADLAGDLTTVSRDVSNLAATAEQTAAASQEISAAADAQSASAGGILAIAARMQELSQEMPAQQPEVTAMTSLSAGSRLHA